MEGSLKLSGHGLQPCETAGWSLQAKMATATWQSGYTRNCVNISCAQRQAVGGERLQHLQYTVNSFDIGVFGLIQPKVRAKT